MKSIHICFTVFVVISFTIGLTGDSAEADGINWRAYDEGMVLGKIEKKKIFLHFYADWCRYCLMMAKDTFQDPAVVFFLNEHFVSIRVDIDNDRQTAVKYGVLGLPYTALLTEMGEPIGAMPGYISAGNLLAILKEVQTIKSSDL